MSTTIEPTAPQEVQTEEPKKTRKHKPVYVVPEGTKLKVTPDDFNPETHRIPRGSFEDVPCYKEHQAWIHEFHAKKLREEAAEWRINPPKKAAGMKKAKLLSRLTKLEDKLKELGVNLDDLFADEESDE